MFYSSPHWDATERGRWLRLVAVAYLNIYQVAVVFEIVFYPPPHWDATERGRWLSLVCSRLKRCVLGCFRVLYTLL